MEPTVFAIILLIPLLAAGAIGFFGRPRDNFGPFVALPSIALIAMLGITWIFLWDGQTVNIGMEWLRLGDFAIDIDFWVNHATVTMLFIVLFVGFWIFVFSVGYMDDDSSKSRYFCGLCIFMFAMLGIVLAQNLFMVFIFWELVGFASYMLIAHYWKTEFAKMASMKAFIVNRIGDLGLLVGIVWAFQYYGTADIPEILFLIETGQKDAVTGIGLLLMCGFVGKSAQLPLQVWLTDAMAGPTPVSALIHAATMVAAGIYFMVRIFDMLTPFVLDWIMWSGALLVMLAGFWALGQRDIKKTLAYSTLSHLGYMAVALGLGLPGLAMMHMAMHAFFKACLFLCAGSVIHACHHEQDMFKMGGLMKKMPGTAATFAIAALSISAFPFFAGYYSKDAIIAVAYSMGVQLGDPQFFWIFGLTLAGALTTALYMMRMWVVVFMGKPSSEKAEHAHESPAWMLVPLCVLAFFSLTAGWFTWTGEFARFNGPLPAATTEFLHDGFVHQEGHLEITRDSGAGYHLAHAEIKSTENHGLVENSIFGTMLLGFVIAFVVYGRGKSYDRVERHAPVLYHTLERHGWFDDLYGLYLRFVQRPVANILAAIDQFVIELVIVRGIGGGITGMTAMVLQALQNGKLHGYVFWFVIGIVAFALYSLGMLG